MGIRFALLPLLLATTAGALEPGERALLFSGGVTVPGGSVGDSALIGFVVGGGLRRQVTPNFSGVLDGEFLQFGDRRPAGGIDSGANVLSIGLSLRLDAPAQGRRHIPFLAVGPTVNRVARRAAAPPLVDRFVDWTPGVAVSAGTMFKLTETLSLGPVGRYRSLGRFGYALEGVIEMSFTFQR